MGSFTSKKIYTYEDFEIMLKNDLKLVIYKNKIYDIKHIEYHPVGFKLIEQNIGKDITEHMFFHSKEAKKIVKKQFIGYIEDK